MYLNFTQQRLKFTQQQRRALTNFHKSMALIHVNYQESNKI